MSQETKRELTEIGKEASKTGEHLQKLGERAGKCGDNGLSKILKEAGQKVSEAGKTVEQRVSPGNS
jgi:hypothetical protein